MPKSMTGYGKGIAKNTQGELLVQIKSLNHRNLDISVRGNQQFFPYEIQIRQLIQQYLQRGWVEVNLNWEESKESAGNLNASQIKQCYQKLLEAQEILGLQSEITLQDVLTGLNIFKKEGHNGKESDWWPIVEPVLTEALKNLSETREREGERLYQDILQRLTNMREIAGKIEAFLVPTKKLYKERIKERLQEFNGDLPENRLTMEIALLVEKSDYTEELVRLKSHHQELCNLATAPGSIGKRLEFITQEVKREINTIGTKALSPELGRLVVDYKDELEKIREQMQNIE